MAHDAREWFHITSHTYGSWLHGDPRSFRTRHHREHIVGDYKDPPAVGMYADKLARSHRLMKQEPVTLAPHWQPIIGAAVRDKLLLLGAQVLAVSMGTTHAHLLAKMAPPPIPRSWIGLAKKHSNFIAKDHGWLGKLWAVRSKAIPIKDRQHQLSTFYYILDHVNEGAWVWDFRQPVSLPPNSSPGTDSSASPGTAVPGLGLVTGLESEEMK
ncbi:MAG TPA: hypothetical protein VKD71_15650 [Gemmataceae bacterium]|nr:hypothetical protein [Gemmataceae bacterium]